MALFIYGEVDDIDDVGDEIDGVFEAEGKVEGVSGFRKEMDVVAVCGWSVGR